MSGEKTVRTTPLIGTKVWFGPRRMGWGWNPVSPEGWIVTAIIAVRSMALKRGDRKRRGADLLLVVLYLAVVVLKGTAPGGARARRAFEAAREQPIGPA
jgi:hypothetical protein